MLNSFHGTDFPHWGQLTMRGFINNIKAIDIGYFRQNYWPVKYINISLDADKTHQNLQFNIKTTICSGSDCFRIHSSLFNSLACTSKSGLFFLIACMPGLLLSSFYQQERLSPHPPQQILTNPPAHVPCMYM